MIKARLMPPSTLFAAGKLIALLTICAAVSRLQESPSRNFGYWPNWDTQYFKLGRNDSSWGFLVFFAFGDPISESQATDRSTFCPMPGGRSQAASDAPAPRPFAWTLA